MSQSLFAAQGREPFSCSPRSSFLALRGWRKKGKWIVWFLAMFFLLAPQFAGTKPPQKPKDDPAVSTSLKKAKKARAAAQRALKRARNALAVAEKAQAVENVKNEQSKEDPQLAEGTLPPVKNIRFVDGQNSARVEILVSPEVSHRVSNSDGALVLVLKGVQLPKALERVLDTSEFNGPIKEISCFPAKENNTVLVQVAVRGRPQHVLRRVGEKLMWEFGKELPVGASQPEGTRSYSYQPSKVAGARVPLAMATEDGVALGKKRRAVKQGRRRYIGRRIDLDFKDVGIHNMLRLLSEVGNVNIIVSDSVKGKVTIRMKDVPWDQALDVILRSKGLGQVREGNLLRVAPLTDLEKERSAEIARQKQELFLKPVETRLIPLSYAQAGAIIGKVRFALSPRGKLNFDQRTNMVIARDVTSNLDLVEQMIGNLDTQTPQVMIESRIVEARTNYSKALGVQWGGNFVSSAATGNSTGLVFPNQFGIGGGSDDAAGSTNGILLGQSANPNFLVNMPVSTGAGAGGALGLTLGSIGGTVNINLRLSAAETTGDIRIVSAPKITTLDNVEAKIEQGVTIPFSTISASGVQTTFRDAKLNLTVKPHVTADGSIIMKVRVSRNEPDFANTGANGDPTILRKEASTQMLVKDGDTAVIGGIYTTRDGRGWTKVPWLSEIPVLGWLFKTRKDSSDREEVLVFITPRIINRAQSIGR
ncbi:MAG: type IV pilus secretin PilQ [Pseudomonadota bacterium]